LKLHEPVTGKEEVDAVKRVFDSGWLAEGKETANFERTVAEYVGARHAVAVSNCTVALELSLRAKQIKGEVVVPAFGHPATVRAIINAGCEPVFVDVDLEDYTVRVDYCPENTKAVIPVSWGGNPIWSIPYDPIIIEDAACSLGASAYGEHVIEYAATTCYSFHPRKLITTGEGGMITTNNKELAEKLRELKNFGLGNYKIDDVRAAIGTAQMHRLEGIIQERIRKARVYNELLADVPNIKSPQSHELARHTYQTYAIFLQTGDRDKIITRLKQRGIETQIGAYALHRLPSFRHFGRIGKLENSDLLAENLLALPMSHSMTDEDQKYVVNCLEQLIP